MVGSINTVAWINLDLIIRIRTRDLFSFVRFFDGMLLLVTLIEIFCTFLKAEKEHGDRLVEIYRERELGTVEVADNAYQKLVDLIERQKKETEEQEEASEKIDDESKPSDTDPHAAEPVSKSDSADEKPDINDVPMEESQDGNQVVRQDLNESTLDLSLGLVS
ncbi:hypothetical protein OIU77_022122 [Salix suchowensis]|uniref:Uncharacterized protein n=1 Tax=Salix suchowensis TaxID=1278906 RepID=A0ABQ9CCB5_9ROSI|nr:hypothetical protein OIU77_022122 [Salix suchowensis]